MAHDALGAHARDELGISETLSARPVQAALASAASFAVGAVLPLAVTVLAPEQTLIPWVSATSLTFLALLGAMAAQAGGADMTKVRCGLPSGVHSRWRSPRVSVHRSAPSVKVQQSPSCRSRCFLTDPRAGRPGAYFFTQPPAGFWM